MNTQKQIEYQYLQHKYYYIVDVWNGEGYSDSKGYLIKIEKSNPIDEYITLLNYMKSLTCKNVTDESITTNELSGEILDALGVFECLGDDSLESRNVFNRHFFNSIQYNYSDADSFNSDAECYENNGCITVYEWNVWLKNSQLMIAPTVCHHEFDDEWKYDFLGMAKECINENYEDSNSEDIFGDMHTHYGFADADFILFNLKDVKLQNAKLVGGAK